jgi:hypothetical protein
MAKLKVADKNVLRLVDSYVVEGFDWRKFYTMMSPILGKLREKVK